MKRKFALLFAVATPVVAVAGPQSDSESFTVQVAADVDAICSLVPEGNAPTVHGDLSPGASYQVSQQFDYGCNAPYELSLTATFGELRNISAYQNGQQIGIDYTVYFNSNPVTLDYAGRATLASVSSYQSLLPLQSHTGSVSVAVPGADDAVAGRYEETFVVTLASTL